MPRALASLLLLLLLAGCATPGAPGSAEDGPPAQVVDAEDGLLAQNDGDQPGDAPGTFEEARDIGTDEVRGTLVPLDGDAEDWYAFALEEGTELAVLFSSSSARWWLYTPAGQLVMTAVEDDRTELIPTFVSSETGMWRLRLTVEPGTVAASAPYSVGLGTHRSPGWHAVSGVSQLVIPITIPEGTPLPQAEIEISAIGVSLEGGVGILAISLENGQVESSFADAGRGPGPRTFGLTSTHQVWGVGTHHVIVVVAGDAGHVSHRALRGGEHVGAPATRPGGASFARTYDDLEGAPLGVTLGNSATGGSLGIDVQHRLAAAFVCPSGDCVEPPEGATAEVRPRADWSHLWGPSAGRYRFHVAGDPGASGDAVVVFGADVELPTT